MLNNFREGICYIVAEIGGNFINYEQGKRLVDEAAKCGVDAIKLQTYKAETIASKKAIFNMENTGVTSQYDLFKKYEIDKSLHEEMFLYAKEKGLGWFSTPSHEDDVDMLEELGVEAYKIGSDDAVNLPFLRYVARKGQPVILATGMCDMEEVRESVNAIMETGNNKIILLHAITAYPTHPNDVNLKAILSMNGAFPDIPVGYSDHTVGTTASVSAAVLGARMIEKHFTYDKKADGPDHMLSADPVEMKQIVKQIRTFEIMRGDGVKRPADGENDTRINNRKSVVLRNRKMKGEVVGVGDLVIKRPGYGIQPKHYDQLVGKIVKRDMDEDDVVMWEDLS